LAFDTGLAVLVLGVAVWTIAARDTFAAVVGFVAFGLLLALVWVGLAAPDVALTEAAIGSGVTGGLLLGASTRLRRTETTAAGELPSAAFRLAGAVLCALVSAGLAAIVLLLPEPAPTLAPQAAANIVATGLGNPVTAVLMAYRAIDTLLETVVLLLALLGIWSLAPDRVWGGFPGPRHDADPQGVLTFAARLLVPLGILVGIHIFWVGPVAPGVNFRLLRSWPPCGYSPRWPGWRMLPGELALVADPAGRRACGVLRDRARRFLDGRRLPGIPAALRQAPGSDDRDTADPVDSCDPRAVGGWPAGTGAAAMSSATLFGLCGAVLVGLGLFGLIVHPQPLRKILAFNLIGGGVFLLFGVVSRRGAAAGFGGDPVPQALVITGLVVAFAATALAVALLLRLFHETGRATLRSDG
jgi:multisubunit Na+/H+ antiporter MnhC subunit/uncharacterized MnhB-related membrane protein